MASNAPVGVFDSGIGGLSILQALRAELPAEDFIYLADSGHAPYGERDDKHVINRARAIISHLCSEEGIKGLVIACNTATAAAIHLLRLEYPEIPIVGVEPALKPATALSKTRRVGVMATRGTLASVKFRALQSSLAKAVEIITQPCDGLAEAIESECRDGDGTRTRTLCERYTSAMGPFGSNPGQIDTLVLGCTHYPFASEHLRLSVGEGVIFLEPGGPVARQTRRLLLAAGLLRSPCPDGQGGVIRLLSTGGTDALMLASQHWLQLKNTPVTMKVF
jgi:glutamate racemase